MSIKDIPKEIKLFWKQHNKNVQHYTQSNNGFIIVYHRDKDDLYIAPPVKQDDVLAVKRDEWVFYFDKKWFNTHDMLKTIKLLSFI